jgi:hypothetical protein
MTTVFERVSTALGTLSPAVDFAMSPFKKDGALPDQYVVYQLIDGSPEQSADDAETQRSYLVQVSIFSRGGLVSLPDVSTAMISAGFQKGHEHQLPQDSNTGHYGLAKDFVYIE